MSNLLVVLASDDLDRTWLKWQNVESILDKHLPNLGHVLVYTGRRVGTADSPTRILLCSCSISSSILDAAHHILLKDFAGIFKTPPELRLYKPLVEPLGISSLNADHTETLTPNHILLSVAMTPHPSADEEFNNWYREEHIPLLMRVLAWRSSERFILEFSANKEVPQYLALHRWDSTEAFNTQEYKAATNTSRRSAVMSEITKYERFAGTYEGKLATLAREITDSS
ncbi:hypothetical protein E4T56_gene15601 [Termitomyces sp. T112]|nr:hypothetical protein E4T56_gene15601 [Termitomyces sp. T112]